MYSKPTGELNYFNNPWIFIDVICMIAMGIGIRKKSRIAACAMVLYWTWSKLTLATELSMNAGSIMISISIFIVFLQTAYATFTFHLEEKKKNPKKQRTKWDVYLEHIASIPRNAYTKFAPVQEIKNISKELEQLLMTGDQKKQKFAKLHLDNLKMIPIVFILINALPIIGIIFMTLMVFFIVDSFIIGTNIDLIFVVVISSILIIILGTYFSLKKFAHWSIRRKLRTIKQLITTHV